MDYFTMLNLANSNGVYRALPSGSITANTPSIFIVAGKSVEVRQDSGIYRIPLEIKVVYLASDLDANPAGLDTLSTTVENALTGSMQYINGSGRRNIFLIQATKPSGELQVVEHTYQYTIGLEVVCKNK